MIAWWDSLGLALQIFYAIAIVSSFFLVLQLLATVFGLGDGDADMDMDADVDLDVDADAGLHLFSSRAVAAFFVGFGWAGVMAVKAGKSIPTATFIALATGTAFMVAVAFVMRAVYGLRQSGTLDYKNAIGAVGSVYLRIPPSMSNPGQVEVIVQGRLRVVQAFTRYEKEIPNQARVRVVDVMDQNTLVVEPLEGDGVAQESTS